MTRWQMFTEALGEWRQQRLERRAFKRTIWLFERLQPQWFEALFDEPFLLRFGTRAVLEMDARELAIEWTRQFSYSDPRRRDREIGTMTKVSQAFQELLAATLANLEERRDAHSRPAVPGARSLPTPGERGVVGRGHDGKLGRPKATEVGVILEHHGAPKPPVA